MTRPESGSFTEAAYRRLRGEILSTRLRPNQKLVIADLCNEMEFSLGAVREALARLSSEGLVIAEPRKGFRVAPITEHELQDITKVRATIEALCLESAIAAGDLRWEAGIVAAEFELARVPLATPEDPCSVSEAWAEAHRRFHEALVSACTSPWLLKIREMLFTQSERYRRISVPLDVSKRPLNDEHKRIAEATIRRDSTEAIQLMRDHLLKTTRILVSADVVKKHET